VRHFSRFSGSGSAAAGIKVAIHRYNVCPGAPLIRVFCEGVVSHQRNVSGSQSTSTPGDYCVRVTSGLYRFYGARHLHFITASCYDRQPLLATASRRDLFLTIIEETRLRYRFAVLAYVIMPEHFHLLVTEPEVGDPSVVMKVSAFPGPSTGRRHAILFRSEFGRSGFMILMFGASGSVSRSCGISIGIR
jgi:hypothetical protein